MKPWLLVAVCCLPILISIVRRQPAILHRWVWILNIFGFTIVGWFAALALSLVGIFGVRSRHFQKSGYT
jgi:hypothetical protein